jgi:TPR repeat protein
MDGTVDISAARSWYKKAMKQGHAGAMFNIGCLYECGLGVEKDMERAIEFFKMAARIGHAESKERIGDMKRVGIIFN